MKKVEIYTTQTCGYCFAAKRLLNKKAVEFTEIDVSRNPELRAEMTQRSRGGRTVPQIFIGGDLVGGFDEMFALDMDGKLDPMLSA
ncbi:MAG TPA: glutaredoxin 3 [Paracoccaceae bacterium]|nr:glutaredoxin 3 [Paracoccaceae bacterium]